MGKNVFDAADKNDVTGALDVSAHIADAAGEGDLRVATQSCRRGHTGRGNKDELKIQIML